MNSVWIVLRGFEDLGGPEVDAFTNEAAAIEQARRCGGDAVWVRQERVSDTAWAEINEKGN